MTKLYIFLFCSLIAILLVFGIMIDPVDYFNNLNNIPSFYDDVFKTTVEMWSNSLLDIKELNWTISNGKDVLKVLLNIVIVINSINNFIGGLLWPVLGVIKWFVNVVIWLVPVSARPYDISLPEWMSESSEMLRSYVL